MNGIPEKVTDELAKGRGGTRKMADNTYLVARGDGSVGLRYHETEVVIFRPDRVTLTTGGWHTMTTRERIEMGLRLAGVPGEISTDGHGLNGPWNYSRRCNGKDGPKWVGKTPFTDGLEVSYKGVPMNADKGAGKADEALVRLVDAYCKRLSKTLREESGWDPDPGGDCWYCGLRTKNGDALGNALEINGHLLDHLKEGYIMSSLMLNAARAHGYRVPAMLLSDGESPSLKVMALHRQSIIRAVRKYFLKELLGKVSLDQLAEKVDRRRAREMR